MLFQRLELLFEFLQLWGEHVQHELLSGDYPIQFLQQFILERDCGLKGVDKFSVGLGMVPRGEVGLVFAGIGSGLGVISDALFSGLVIMIAISTVIAPPALNWFLHVQSAKLILEWKSTC